MGTYFGTLERLVKNSDMEAVWRSGLQGRDPVEASKEMRKYIRQYAYSKWTHHPEDIHKPQMEKRVLHYFYFPFGNANIVNRLGNAVRIYNFFFKPLPGAGISRTASDLMTEEEAIDINIELLQERKTTIKETLS